MPKGSFTTMQTATNTTEVTFYYIQGHAESFTLPIAPEQFHQQMETLLQKPWLTFHLYDQTVSVATSHLMKVEIKPAIAQFQGEGVFADCQRVTTMQRGASGRLGVSE